MYFFFAPAVHVGGINTRRTSFLKRFDYRIRFDKYLRKLADILEK
jgi:hypothetical protein